LTDPDPSQVGLAEPEWAGWASRPVGPAGWLGQQASWAKQALANCFKSKFQIQNSNVISFLNSNRIQKFK
jgi:hypothetical protein